MPGGDRTGPAGAGPMTGRAAGYCTGYSVPGFVNRGFGFGGGRWGGGRGHRNRFYATGLTGWQRAGWRGPGFVPATVGAAQELTALQRQAEDLAVTLDQIRQRIAELEPKTQQQ